MSAILQTRPQGEKSAERALEARGVPTVRPVERVVIRRHLKNGKSECVEREVALMPGYVAADAPSQHHLECALGDMAMRDRKDVIRVVGFASEASMSHIMERHGKIHERDTVRLKVGQIAKLIDGAFQGFQVRIQALTPTKVRFMLNGIPMTAPIEHCEAV